MWFIADRRAGPASARVAVPAVVPVTIAVAWAGLLVAELADAPMSHDALAGGSLPLGVAFGIFGVAWVAMVVAMMLPPGYPMVRAFAAAAADLPNRTARVAPFLVGYVAVWTMFGFALFAGDLGDPRLTGRLLGPRHRPCTAYQPGPIIAGAFQLTERKRRCLSRCREPAAFLRHHDPQSVAGSVRGVALRLGVAYGAHCLSSCWALMLAVFALGSPELAWMALFGGVMVYEKIGRHSQAVARLAGATLLVASVVVALS
jgi:predicted metal-binding membrane protein